MGLTADLYPYQEEALGRFLDRGNLLLAFDTGLGKTLTSIAAAEHLLETGQAYRVLIIVPASLKYQWSRAIARFTDIPVADIKVKGEVMTVASPASCTVIDGPPERREKQYKIARQPACEYVICGYEQAVSDYRRIRQFAPDFVILDEASAIKTPGSKRSKAVKRHFAVPFRLALTATPVENKPEEIYSIMRWADPDLLGRHDLFDRAYITRDAWGGVLGYKNLDILHRKLAPAIVRKTRHDPDVAPYMPDVTSGTWQVEADEPTRQAYAGMAKDLLAAYATLEPSAEGFSVDAHYGMAPGDPRGDKSALGRLVSVRGCMEMLLAHPAVVAKSAQDYLETDDKGSAYAAQLAFSGRLDWQWTSSKLDVLIANCRAILDDDPDAKILVFTFYRQMLPLMQARFALAGHKSVLYHGGLTAKDKEAAVAKFGADPEIRVFISSHAGAYGVDMPMASWLVNYDIPWGAGKATQINGRHVRASSEFENVHVRDMVVTGTVEERRLDGKAFKGAVAAGIIDGTAAPGELKPQVMDLREHALEAAAVYVDTSSA